MKDVIRKITSSKMFASLAALFLILLVNAIFLPGFLRITIINDRLFGELIDIINRAVPVMVLAMGMTLVIATGGTDLSCGALLALAGAVSI